MSKETEDKLPSFSKKKASRWECEAIIGGEEILCSATEWSNGDGFDLCVGDKPPLSISLSEFDVLKILFDGLNTDFHTVHSEED